MTRMSDGEFDALYQDIRENVGRQLHDGFRWHGAEIYTHTVIAFALLEIAAAQRQIAISPNQSPNA